jgi:cell wall assembly regulator SMI1
MAADEHREWLMLSHELLEQLERRWREAGWRGLGRLRPGLSDEQLDALTEPLGLRLPTEARMWWGWHDGIVPSGPGFEAVFGGSDFEYLPLDRAVDAYLLRRALAAEVAVASQADGYGEEYWWHPSWFPITEGGGGTTIACDCSVPFGDPTPIRSVRWDLGDEWAVPRVDSFGELVRHWIAAIDRGTWCYDASQDRWRGSSTYDPVAETKNLL